MTPAIPTRATARPAPPSPDVAAPAKAAAPFTGKVRLLPFVIGVGLALALADTRAAPVVIAILTGAIIFQLMHL